jgi:hypothetical protein
MQQGSAPTGLARQTKAATSPIDEDRGSVGCGDEVRNGWKPGMWVGERVRMEAEDLGPIDFYGLHSITAGAVYSTTSRRK